MLRFGVLRGLGLLGRALSTVSRPAPFLAAVLRTSIVHTLNRMQPIQFLLWPTAEPTSEPGTSEPGLDEDNTMYMDSVLRKRRLKMKKHKLRKRRRSQRALKKRLGKL